MDKIALKVSGIIFLLIGIAHLFRFFLKVAVVVNGHVVPLWLSALGAVVMLGLAFWVFQSSKIK